MSALVLKRTIEPLDPANLQAMGVKRFFFWIGGFSERCLILF